MQEILKYLIVDDVEIDSRAIEALASGYSFLKKVATCQHALEAIELVPILKPDILFADIEMPGSSGLELVRHLAGSVPVPVFITSHPEFALEGFEIDAFDYILKPVNPDRFGRCVSRIRAFYELRSKSFAFDKENQSEYIVIKQGYDKYKISMHDILYLEAMKDYTRMVTLNNQYLILGTFTSMHDQLPADRFIRIHRSYIVNQHKIESVAGNRVFISGHELPVGKSYKYALEGIL
ncbi:MAG TPA: LytTR family DNA-binding domain-containing protein [Puia sp.]|nr:LytTR family DNA-binding domain-containing protein [Puia sp.]